MKVYHTSILLSLLSSVALFTPVAAKKKKCFAKIDNDTDSGRKTRFLKSKPGKMAEGDLDAGCDEADETAITLLSGKTFTFLQDHTSQGEAGHWYGESEVGTFEFISTGSIVTGTIVDLDDGLVYTLHAGNDGEQVIEAHPNSEFLDEGHAHGEDEIDWEDLEEDTGDDRRNLRGGKALLNFDEEEIRQRALNGNHIIDIMVIWTIAAECQFDGQKARCQPSQRTWDKMFADVQLAIAETNTAFTKSQINAQLRLVHAYRNEKFLEGEDLYQGTSSYDQLDMITYATGAFDDTHQNRNTYGADMVALINNRYDVCGVAWRSSGPYASSMFSVTNHRCSSGYFTFGHEVGHNVGFNHDMGVNKACSSSSGNYGYRDPEMRFRTIMSYSCGYGGSDYQCDINSAASGYCGRVQHFSNPDVSYSGMPTGIKDKADNAAYMNSVAYTISQFKPTVVGAPTTTTLPTTTTEEVTTTEAATTGPQTTTEEVTTTTTSTTTSSTTTTTQSSSCSGSLNWSKKKALDDSLKALRDNNLLNASNYNKAIKHNKQMWNLFKKKNYSKAISKIKSVIWRINAKAKSSSIKTTALNQANCIKDLLETF